MQPPLPINLESVHACRLPLKPDSAFATVLLLYIIVLSKWIMYFHLADRMNLELEHLAVDGVWVLSEEAAPLWYSCCHFYSLFYT